ncbi:MAG: hypothetical protein JNM88_14555 [Chitinophagaceae bacterium]|nr:hypothetical protein [Chitinophagaceae bacterium]
MKIRKVKTNVTGWQEDLEANLLEVFEHNEKIKAFFDRYSATSAESFKERYIEDKIRWYEQADFYERMAQDDEAYWLSMASKQLQVIQQKKLFDLQCQWRAEQITLPGVELSFDFMELSMEIMNCSFLPPVTPDDIAMYKQYLTSENADLNDSWWNHDYDWQNYEELKESQQTGNGDIDFPDWYDYHNACTGNQVLLLLPDTRGAKEEYYMDKWRQHNDEKNKTEQEDNPRDTRPFLSSYEDAEEFIRLFDDIYTLKHYQNYVKVNNMFDVKEEYMDMVETLLNADSSVAMEPHSDWREGLRITVEKYKRKKITEALDTAYEQYEMSRSMGISFPPNGKKNKYIRDMYYQGILKGRQLNGEPEDLNF